MIRYISAALATTVVSAALAASPASADRQHDVRGFDRPGCKASSYSSHNHRKHGRKGVTAKFVVRFCNGEKPALKRVPLSFGS